MSISRSGLGSTVALSGFWLLVSMSIATAQQRVGSFVSGERAMYIEISPLVEGQPLHLELRNVPTGSSSPLLIASTSVNIIDLTPYGYEGYLGTDLAGAVLVPMTTTTLDSTVPAGSAGATVYLQACLKTPTGKRLTSMVTTHIVASASGSGGSPKFPLPLTTQEVLASGRTGYDRTQEPVRVGVPLPQGTVFDTAGVPALKMVGSTAASQFSSLAHWPDGSVKWALCEYETDLAANAQDTSFSIDHGNGNAGGPNLATVSGTKTTIDTGVLRLVLDSAQSDLFSSFQRAGREVFDLTKGNLPHYFDDSDAEWTWHKLAVSVRRNGPVRAEVEIDGMFTRSSSSTDPDRIFLRFYVEAFLGKDWVRATVSLRDTSVQFPEHLLFRGLTWSAWLKETGSFDLRLPEADTDGGGSSLWSGSILSGQDASYFHGFVRSSKAEFSLEANWSNYYPFIERYGNDSFAFEGVRARIGSTYFTGSSSTGWFTTETEFADPLFLESNCHTTGHGLLIGLEHASRTWPVDLQADGDGRVEIQIFPHKLSGDTYDYPLTYASAETRQIFLVAEDAPNADPVRAAFSFDYPLAARADPWVYNQSKVWPWHLVSSPDVDTYAAFSGLRAPAPPSTDPSRTVYRYSNATGGGNNNWEETRRFMQWLRSGGGGGFLNSWYEALYKTDKMCWSIDDDTLSNRQPIRNPGAPVTKKTDFYDNSKHMFFQAVADWGFTRGETILLDSARSLGETLMDPIISANVQPYGNFVAGTFGAIVNAAVAVLDLAPNQALEDWLHSIMSQWTYVVFQQSNSFGIDTSTLGWQAPVGTAASSSLNPDGYMITWAAGKSSDKAQYGYTSQPWTDNRGGALAYWQYAHHLHVVAPTDPLIGDLLLRAEDWYHFAHRGLPDDYCPATGEFYMLDVFQGDGGNPSVDPYGPPGYDTGYPNQSGYANQSVVSFLLELRESESAYSYGVELHRSQSRPTFDEFVNDPVVNDFIWRYLVHYGLIQP